MSGGAVHLIPDFDHFEAHMALERVAAIVDLIANAGPVFDNTKSNAAFSASDALYEAMKKLRMEDGKASPTAPVLALVNQMMAAADDAKQQHTRAIDAISAFVARGNKRKLSEAIDGIQTAQEANERAYMAAIAIGAALPRGDA